MGNRLKIGGKLARNWWEIVGFRQEIGGNIEKIEKPQVRLSLFKVF